MLNDLNQTPAQCTPFLPPFRYLLCHSPTIICNRQDCLHSNSQQKETNNSFSGDIIPDKKKSENEKRGHGIDVMQGQIEVYTYSLYRRVFHDHLAKLKFGILSNQSAAVLHTYKCFVFVHTVFDHIVFLSFEIESIFILLRLSEILPCHFWSCLMIGTVFSW